MTPAERTQTIAPLIAAAAAVLLAAYGAWCCYRITAQQRDYLAEAFTRLPPPVPRSVWDPAEELP